MAKMKVWERGQIVRKPDTFVKTGGGAGTKRRLRDPLARPLSKRQINAAFIRAGVNDPDSAIQAAVEAIADPIVKALALNDWRHATTLGRGHVVFTDTEVLQHLGKSSDEMDEIWLAGANAPR